MAGSSYKPDLLSSGGATQKAFSESNVPKTGSIVPTLLKLALRRLPGAGFTTAPDVTRGTHSGSVNTAGSHGKLR